MSFLRMGRRHRQEPEDLDVTPLLNLLIILLPVLMTTAAFSQITALQVDVPAANQRASAKPAPLQLDIVVNKDDMTVYNGRHIAARIARTQDGKYDYGRLSDVMQQIKRGHPHATRATILLQQDTKYAVLVHTMDAIRMVKRPDPDHPHKTVQQALFPQISLGDAPKVDS